MVKERVAWHAKGPKGQQQQHDKPEGMARGRRQLMRRSMCSVWEGRGGIADGPGSSSVGALII